MHPKISWPNNKQFAFTIFDDTDRANLKDIQLVYKCLDELGFKTNLFDMSSPWVGMNLLSYDQETVLVDERQENLIKLLENH